MNQKNLMRMEINIKKLLEKVPKINDNHLIKATILRSKFCTRYNTYWAYDLHKSPKKCNRYNSNLPHKHITSETY